MELLIIYSYVKIKQSVITERLLLHTIITSRIYIAESLINVTLPIDPRYYSHFDVIPRD